MSTRSGKRIHGSRSLHENIESAELNVAVKSERKSRNKRLKENCDEINVALFNSKKRKNYVSYPTDDEYISDTSKHSEAAVIRTLRKNTLKELSNLQDCADSFDTKNLIRTTRRTKKFAENEEAPQTTEQHDIPKQKSKKSKKKNNPSTIDNKTDVVVKKKSKKKKNLRQSGSMIVEDIVSQEAISDKMNGSSISSDSFHSAASTPENTNKINENTVLVEQCDYAVQTTQTRKTRSKTEINTENVTTSNDVVSKSKESRKRKLSIKQNDHSSLREEFPIDYNYDTTKTAGEAKNNSIIKNEEDSISNITITKGHKKKSLKNITSNKDMDMDVDIEGEVRNGTTFEKASPKSINHAMSEVEDCNKIAVKKVKDGKKKSKKKAKVTKTETDVNNTTDIANDNKNNLCKSPAYKLIDEDANKIMDLKSSQTIKVKSIEDTSLEIDTYVNTTFEMANKNKTKSSSKDTPFTDATNKEKNRKSSIKDVFEKEANINTTFEMINKVRERKSTVTDSTVNEDSDTSNAFDAMNKDLKRKSTINDTFEKNTKVNTTFEMADKSARKSTIKDTTFEKDTKANITFEMTDKDKRKSVINNTTFEKDTKGNTTFEIADKSTRKSTIKDTTFEKDTKVNTTFEMTDKDKRKSTVNNTTFEKDTNVNTTFEMADKDIRKSNIKDTTFEKDANINSTFELPAKDKRKSTNKDTLSKDNTSIEATDNSKRKSTSNDDKSLNSTNKTVPNNKRKHSDINMFEDDNIDCTFDKDSKSSLISSDNTNVTLDKSDISRISITSDESEIIMNQTPVLIESSIESLNATASPVKPEIKPVTPMKREGTFTKDSPEMRPSSPRLSKEKTPTKRMSLPSPGCTPFPVKSVSRDRMLNVTRSIEKARRSSVADAAPRTTKVMFCSPVNNPAVVIQQKRKVIKSNLKGSNKSFIFDDSAVAERPAGRKRSYTHGDAEQARAKRSRPAPPGPATQPPARKRPRTVSATAKLLEPSPHKASPSKTDAKCLRTKLPNFAALHQRQFARMESLDDCQRRRAQRAKLLLTPTGTMPRSDRSPKELTTEVQKPTATESVKKTETPVKKSLTLDSLKPGYTRFGFKMNLDSNPFIVPRVKPEEKPLVKKQVPLPSLAGATTGRKEVAKLTIMREKSFTDRRNLKRVENRTVIKGVRTNRRFELQMKMRNID